MNSYQKTKENLGNYAGTAKAYAKLGATWIATTIASSFLLSENIDLPMPIKGGVAIGLAFGAGVYSQKLISDIIPSKYETPMNLNDKE